MFRAIDDGGRCLHSLWGPQEVEVLPSGKITQNKSDVLIPLEPFKVAIRLPKSSAFSKGPQFCLLKWHLNKKVGFDLPPILMVFTRKKNEISYVCLPERNPNVYKRWRSFGWPEKRYKLMGFVAFNTVKKNTFWLGKEKGDEIYEYHYHHIITLTSEQWNISFYIGQYRDYDSISAAW